ncbi:MAG: M20/M25/M40 family metallo-hydrolase [Holophagaceae bacterium]|nr:M20/M25/M40 family metallo-hydrolase [Holophagaceae bacterium]
MNPSELLEFLVATPSVSKQEGLLAMQLANALRCDGFTVHQRGNNLWFEVGQGGPRLLVNSHLDTVPPCEGWDTDPHLPVWKEDRLYGLGANDAKGCVAAMITAAVALAKEPGACPGTAVFAFTAEEEIGGDGIATILDELGPLDAAIVGEPTGLKPCIAQRGMLILRCVAKGESAHVAHAALGDNAIHKAARDIAKLAAKRFEGHALLGVTSPQVTTIHGGLSRNQVPDAVEFFVDLRTTPNLDHEALARELAGELESEVHVHSGRYLPKATAADHPLARAAQAASGTSPVGSHTTSDWAFLGAIPAVKVGPGDTHRSHRPNEYLTRPELEAGCAFYGRMIRAYFAEAAKAVKPSEVSHAR